VGAVNHRVTSSNPWWGALTRIPLPFRVTTWYAESTDAHGGGSDKVIAALRERLDGLIHDYYKANPRS